MGLTFGDVGCRQTSTTAHWVSCSSTFRKGSPAWSGTHSARRLALLTRPARSRCASSRWAIGLVAFTMPFLKLILPVRCRSRRSPSFLAPFQCMRRVHTATSQTITSGLFSVDFVLQMCRYVYLPWNSLRNDFTNQRNGNKNLWFPRPISHQAIFQIANHWYGVYITNLSQCRLHIAKCLGCISEARIWRNVATVTSISHNFFSLCSETWIHL